MNFNTTSTSSDTASNMTSEVSSLASFLGRAAYEAHVMRPLLPTYLHLLISALFPIWIASHASLVRPTSASKPVTKTGSSSDDEDEPEEVSQKIENLSTSDALLFPLMAGVVLAGLYFLLKNLQDPAWLNWGLNLYFSQMGVFFAYRFLADAFAVLRNIVFPRCYSWKGALWKIDEDGRRYIQQNTGEAQKLEHTSPLPGPLRGIPLPRFMERSLWSLREKLFNKASMTLHLKGYVTLHATPTILDYYAILLAAVLSYFHAFVAKPWQLTNFFGLAFCYGSLQLTSPSTAWTGTLLLSGLFFYDIYMVFFTPMMVHVATNLDVPIKMLFPRPDGCTYPAGAAEGSTEMEEYLKCLSKKRAMAMLGLGDIVVPGIVMAFALRWDLWLHYLKQQKPIPKPDTDDATVDGTNDQAVNKEPYRAVTGGWGERFWTSYSRRPLSLRSKSFKKTYFYATVVGYILGMCTTVAVMQVAKHAQPALLYLVPGVLGALWGTALVRGEIKLLWHYSEDDEDEEKKKKQKADQSKVDDEKAAKDATSTDDSKAPMKAKTPKASDIAPEGGDAGDDDEQDAKLQPQVRKELKFARKHAIYFSFNFAESSVKAKKNASNSTELEDEDTIEVTDSAKKTTRPTSSSSSSPRRKGVQEADDDTQEEDVVIVESPRPNQRVLRSSGAADVLEGLDEEAKRSAKRRRKA